MAYENREADPVQDAQMMDCFFVYVTAKDETEAERIARAAVDERLAACANLLGPIRSIYRWQGEVCDEPEVALILKTTAARSNELTARIRELHSYDGPCIVCLPVTGGNPDFLGWMAEETGV